LTGLSFHFPRHPEWIVAGWRRLSVLAKKTYRRPVPVVAVLWFLSTFIAGPLAPESVSSSFHRQLGPVYLGRPVLTWGDPPHYLILVSSLVEDFDFDVADNYREAEEGDWDAGTRFRGRRLDHHTDVDRRGRELLFHPPFVPLVISVVAYPFRDSQWVESCAVWTTMAAVLVAIVLLRRRVGGDPRVIWWTALATPLWCYSRDLWTESWLVLAWSILLAVPSLWVMGMAAAAGVLVKYSFAVVPATLALVAAWRKDWKRAVVLAVGTGAGLLVAIAWIQYLFWDTDHFSLFHNGFHRSQSTSYLLGRFGASWQALPGLLFSPRDGLLLFFPFLAWGLVRLRKGGETFLPAISFLLLHGAYLGWRGGSGFSARYLVPMIPVLMLGVLESNRRPHRLFRTALLWSILFGVLGGLVPAAVFDRNPWEIISFLVSETARSLGVVAGR
jgi:hypothetical protein